MKQRTVAIAVGVLALAGLGAMAHHSSSARAFQPAPAAPATSVSSPYLDPVAPAAAPAPAMPTASTGPATTQALDATTAPALGGAATPVAAAPAGERIVYRDRVVSRTRPAARARYSVHERSKKHSVMIIGGSTVGGAGIGALVGGKKGALIGGLVGGAAGTVYDRTTHKKVQRQ